MDPKEYITKDRSTWTLDERVAHERELASRREAWEEQHKAEAEERERKEKQARMEAWLGSRRQAWIDHTGSLPPASMVEGWKAEYIVERASEQELELELRRVQAAADAVI